MSDTAEAAPAPQPFPVNAVFGDDFVTQLVLGMTDMTIDQFAEAVAVHSVGKRLRDLGLPKKVIYEGKVLDGDTMLVESGIVPLTNVYVDWVYDDDQATGGPSAESMTVSDIGQRRLVGPVLRMSDDIGPVLAAIEDDNPDADIDVVDQGAYVRIQTTGRLRLTRESAQRRLGQRFELRQLEASMSAFSGRIHTSTDEIVWEYDEEAGS
ncbi:MmoB/DmpM family protein [Candidatus Poriferisodalis sp.]|uniref:MmoB/DmpM family protein n=1 Tax=Candidatus Poriferisodalis sp. TaxID=3101277 RepID=UPI003B018B66